MPYYTYQGKLCTVVGRLTSDGPVSPWPVHPVARYAFDNNNNDSIQGLDFDAGGTYASGVIGNAVVLNASFVHNNAEKIRTIIDGTKSFTIAFWIKRTVNGYVFAIDGPGASSPYKRLWIRVESNLLLIERFYQPTMFGSANNCVFASGLTFDSTWRHTAVVYNSAVSPYAFVYQNGVAKTMTTNWTSAGNVSMTDYVTEGATLSGWNGLEPISGFGGSLDLLYVYDRALTATEVAQLYNNGEGI